MDCISSNPFEYCRESIVFSKGRCKISTPLYATIPGFVKQLLLRFPDVQILSVGSRLTVEDLVYVFNSNLRKIQFESGLFLIDDNESRIRFSNLMGMKTIKKCISVSSTHIEHCKGLQIERFECERSWSWSDAILKKVLETNKSLKFLKIDYDFHGGCGMKNICSMLCDFDLSYLEFVPDGISVKFSRIDHRECLMRKIKDIALRKRLRVTIGKTRQEFYLNAQSELLLINQGVLVGLKTFYFDRMLYSTPTESRFSDQNRLEEIRIDNSHESVEALLSGPYQHIRCLRFHFISVDDLVLLSNNWTKLPNLRRVVIKILRADDDSKNAEINTAWPLELLSIHSPETKDVYDVRDMKILPAQIIKKALDAGWKLRFLKFGLSNVHPEIYEFITENASGWFLGRPRDDAFNSQSFVGESNLQRYSAIRKTVATLFAIRHFKAAESGLHLFQRELIIDIGRFIYMQRGETTISI